MVIVEEKYVSSKGLAKSRKVQSTRTLAALAFFEHFQHQTQTFKAHHWKIVFVGMAHEKVRANMPRDWMCISLDCSADVVRKAHHELTCMASRTATLAPMVIQRWACPDTDPMVGGTPEALAYRKMVSAKPGDMDPILEGHCFLSSTTKYKGPDVTRYMLETVMAWYAERGVAKPHTICLDTDNCAAQIKSSRALLTVKDIGMSLALDVRHF